MSDADTVPEVQAYIVDPTEGRDLSLWRPPSDLTETQKAAVEQYQRHSNGSIAQAQAPNAFVSDYETIQAFALAGALAPPEDPRQVANIYRRSSALRPCVEAIATNAVGFGFDFEPVIDLEHADAGKRIREAIIQDRLAQGNETEPTDADIQETRALIERESLREKFKLERFFAHICPTHSFNRLRWESVIERESGGNAFWEVTRRADRTHHTWDRIEAHTMRLRRTEERYLMVEMNQRRSPLAYERAQVPIRFRTYVQLVLGGAKAIYFKQYGDERTLSSATGRWYPNRQMLSMAEGSTPPATEIIHWSCFDTIGPYGLPPWYGAQYAVMGNLASERVNYDYFDNKAIPPFAIFVSGGKLKEGALDKINEILKGIKGQAAFWKVLVLEADSAGGQNARCKIELHPLIKAMPEDALFQQYEANNGKKIQQQWRLHDALVGRSAEVNRAQIEGVQEIAEQQVFQPKREVEDDFFNRFILPEMGIRFWTFKTNSAVTRDPARQTELVTKMVEKGILTPNEGRSQASDVFNRDYAPKDDPRWETPYPLLLKGIIGGGGGAEPVTGEQEAQADGLAKGILAARDALRGQAEAGQAKSMGEAHKRETQAVRVSAGEWSALWE